MSDRDLGLAYGVFAEKSSFARSEALRLLRSAREKGQADPIALTEFGYLLKREGNLDAASSAFQEALRGDPINVRATIYLGQIYRGTGKVKEALELWKGAFELDPHSVGPLLADAQCQLGDRKRAITTLERVLRFDPDSNELRMRVSDLSTGAMSCGR